MSARPPDAQTEARTTRSEWHPARTRYEREDRLARAPAGAHSPADLQDLYGGALALLFPIDWPEPFGLVLIEAMACGTPILARPRGSVPEIVTDGVNGYHCEDADEMIRALERIDRIDRAACRRVFEERFTARRMALGHLRVYERMLGPVVAAVEADVEPAEPTELGHL